MNNLSMGGHVADDLSGCVNQLPIILPKSYPQWYLTQKPFSSGLHKKFCKKHGYCGNKREENDL